MRCVSLISKKWKIKSDFYPLATKVEREKHRAVIIEDNHDFIAIYQVWGQGIRI